MSACQNAPFCLCSPFKNNWIAVKYAGEIKKKRLISRHSSLKVPQRSTFSRFIHHFVHQFSLSMSDRPSGSCTGTLFCFRLQLSQRELALCYGNYKHWAAREWVILQQQLWMSNSGFCLFAVFAVAVVPDLPSLLGFRRSNCCSRE